MKAYLKSRVWDWCLCLGISTGLVFPLFSGFLLEDGLFNNIPLVVLLLGLVLFLLEVVSYSRTWIRIGLVIGLIGTIAYLVYLRINNVFGDETAHSLGVTCTVLVGTALFVYLASRTRAGIAVLLVLGNLILCGAHFLLFPVQVWCLFLFLFMVLLMYLYRVYLATLMSVQSGKVRIPKFLKQAAGLCLLAGLLASGAYYGLIKPLNPPTKDLYLITKLENMDLLRVLGVSSVRELLDPSLITSEMAQQLEYTNQLAEEEGEQQADSETEEPEEEETKEDNAATGIKYNISRFRMPWSLIIILGIILLLTGLLIYRRKRWQKELLAMSPENQILNYYHYFLRKFSRAGWKKPSHYTLYEYGDNLEYEMELFITDGISFLDLTDIYVGVVYGGNQVTEENLKAFRNFYQQFEKNMIKELGRGKYIRRFMWI